MHTLSLIFILNSCAYISNDDVNLRLDPDQDGLGWEDDCAEKNPYLSEPLEWYLDADGDGYGDPLSSMSACVQPEGYLNNKNDCNDDPTNNGALFNPQALEICDGFDNNCNGLIDDDDNTYISLRCTVIKMTTLAMVIMTIRRFIDNNDHNPIILQNNKKQD